MDRDETNKKIEELQVLEQHLQGILMQKQSLQVEMNEINNAIKEVGTAGDEVYKIISGAMIRSDKKKITKDLDAQNKEVSMKINALEKQEKLLETKAKSLREEINKESQSQ